MKAGKDQDLDQELDIKSVLQYIKRKQLLNQINDFSAKIQKVDTSLGGVAFFDDSIYFSSLLIVTFYAFCSFFWAFYAWWFTMFQVPDPDHQVSNPSHEATWIDMLPLSQGGHPSDRAIFQDL